MYAIFEDGLFEGATIKGSIQFGVLHYDCIRHISSLVSGQIMPLFTMSINKANVLQWERITTGNNKKKTKKLCHKSVIYLSSCAKHI